MKINLIIDAVLDLDIGRMVLDGVTDLTTEELIVEGYITLEDLTTSVNDPSGRVKFDEQFNKDMARIIKERFVEEA